VSQAWGRTLQNCIMRQVGRLENDLPQQSPVPYGPLMVVL
jgi:hypothetical protein